MCAVTASPMLLHMLILTLERQTEENNDTPDATESKPGRRKGAARFKKPLGGQYDSVVSTTGI